MFGYGTCLWGRGQLDVSTKSGNVGVEALYGDICRIMTISGNILIGDAHGILSLHSESGDVILGTLYEYNLFFLFF